MKKFFLGLIGIILITPGVFKFASGLFNKSFDVSLNGYSSTTEKPAFSYQSYLDGTFQTNFSSWFEENLKPRGIITKTYSSIRYNFFNLGNNPIGYNGDIFEPKYIYSELCIEGYPDYNDDVNLVAMKDYIKKIEIVNKKLAEKGKILYVYITPNKAYFDSENILPKYKGISADDSYNAIECFSNLIKETNVPYLICRDMEEELEYPAFYTTGIHWSRTYEQLVSSRIIDNLSQLTGKNYRRIILGDVEQSSVPYWRDADIYDLLNVWNKNTGNIYYQYQTFADDKEEYDPISVLVQGTSFAQGIGKDISDLYPYDNVYFMRRDESIYSYSSEHTENIEAWDTFDITNYLNNVDAVVLETTEAELNNYSWGLLDYLISFLDTYEPGSYSSNYVSKIDCNMDEAWSSDSIYGFYDREEGFAWIKKYARAVIEANDLSDSNIELEISIPDSVFTVDSEPDVIEIYINRKKVIEKTYTEAWDGSIIINSNLIPDKGDVCSIEIYASKSVNPKDLGWSDDSRDLALQVKYIGGER